MPGRRADSDGPGAGRRGGVMPWAIALGTLALLTWTLGDYGMAWDEGFVVERVDRLREWSGRVAGDSSPGGRAWAPATSNLRRRADYLAAAGPSAASPWSRESLRFFWPFAREEPDGHPPFYALLSLAGWAVAHHFLPPPASYRFGPAALCALTTGVIYAFMARRYGGLAGWTAALGLAAMPRVFAHEHLATTDAATLCGWTLAVVAFLGAAGPSPGRRAWTVAFGVAWGCAAATKLPGWLVPAPLLAWSLLYRDRRGLLALALGAPIAGLILYALIPTWWADPIRGVEVFLRSNLSRESRSPIPTLFFGRVYPFALPWYNTLAWTAIVTPPATLALALVGAARVILGRLRDRQGALILGCWAFFLLLRGLPGAPGHDGERQFLPAFAFLACLAGSGLAATADAVARLAPPRLARPSAVALLVLALGPAARETWRYHPLELSYYNIFIGGPAGAARAGMEPTYYWDALTPRALAWINARTDPGRSVMFAYPIPTFDYLHRWGLLRPPPHPDRDHPPRWYIVQNRPGILRTYGNCALADHLIRHARPAYAETLADAPGVPLLAVFAIEDAAEAERAMALGADRRSPP